MRQASETRPPAGREHTEAASSRSAPRTPRAHTKPPPAPARKGPGCRAGDTGAAPSALREAPELPGPAAEPP